MQTLPANGRGMASTIAVIFLFGLGGIQRAHAQIEDERAQQYLHVMNDPRVHITDQQSDLEIIEKFTKILELDRKIKIVDGFDPDIVKVDAIPRAPNSVRVNALQPGITSLLIIDDADNTYVVDVMVAGDARHLQAVLSREFPNAAVRATKVRDAVLLRGWVTQPEHITAMVDIAEVFFPQVLNQMRVAGVQQVLLRVKVMEVQRSKSRTLGINFLAVTNGGYFANTIGSIVPVSGIALSPGGRPNVNLQGTALRDNSILFGVVDANHTFQAFIEAMKQESLLKILAEPEIVATNGRPANLLSGGEFPILVPQSLGTVTIEYKEFGVRLEAVPIVLGNGRLRLDLEPEVSERDFSNAVEISGILVPGLTTRRVNTQVEMNLGDTLVIAGLLSKRDIGEATKVPFLGELPGIGALFSRKSFEETETELLIMVTPELVAPGEMPECGPGMNTDAPVDRELYFQGVLEVPNFGSNCPDGCMGDEVLGPAQYPPAPGLIQPYDPMMPTEVPPIPSAQGNGSGFYNSERTRAYVNEPAQAPPPMEARATRTSFEEFAPMPPSGSGQASISTNGMRLPVRPGLIEPKPTSQELPSLRDSPAPHVNRQLAVP